MNRTENQMLVIFGASGDLTARKLVPALFNLYVAKQLPEHFAVLGASRSNMTDAEFRTKVVLESTYLKDKLKDLKSEYIEAFANLFFYEDLGDSYDTDYGPLRKRVGALNDARATEGNIMYYLSTPPTLYETIAKNLDASGLNTQNNGWKRVIVEKPFGYDLETAKELNTGLQRYFKEHQIYRIDHYLGKETVQNLLVTRFANSIFEPLWNRNYIHHVEITNAESVGVEKRGGYYDSSGALRDMFQNHLLQIVSLIVMEPPIGDQPEEIRNEKVKALKSLRIMKDDKTLHDHTIRAQYMGSNIDGETVKGYREEPGVAEDSLTETGMHEKDNKLIIRIQPDEGVLIKFGVKVPGQGFKVERANLDFYYSSLAETNVMQAYERLLLDAMQGDATLYARADEVEAAWEFVDPILEFWKNGTDVRMYGYPSGVWGPENSDELIDGIGVWRNPGPNLTDDQGFCVLC